jgi:uncharacterized protein (DUF697 family)
LKGEDYDVDHDEETESDGRRLLTAVERLVDDSDHLIAQVEAIKYGVPDDGRAAERYRDAIAQRIIKNYSTRSAMAGGVSAMPAILPGAGTAIAVGGALVDMTLMLKHEVEMVLSLTYLYGHDIRQDDRRWLGYALAGVSTYEATSGRNYFVDLADAEVEALTKYTTRQLSKLVATVLGKVALVSASKSLLRVLPLVGVVVGASTNKVLTHSVGWTCVDALERYLAVAESSNDPIVDAKVV